MHCPGCYGGAVEECKTCAAAMLLWFSWTCFVGPMLVAAFVWKVSGKM